MATTYPTTTGDALLSPRPSPSPVPSPTTNTAIASSRPTLPRRSSSLHKMVITKLRPLPFQYRWAVWHSKPDAQQQYLLTPLVDDVPDIGTFYRIFNNMPWVQIKQNDSIHIFRSGVKPLWEDAENQRGGRWLIRVRPDNGRAIRVWEEICLLCCGGELQAAIAQGMCTHLLPRTILTMTLQNGIISWACLSRRDYISPTYRYGPSRATICAVYCCSRGPLSRVFRQICGQGRTPSSIIGSM